MAMEYVSYWMVLVTNVILLTYTEYIVYSRTQTHTYKHVILFLSICLSVHFLRVGI